MPRANSKKEAVQINEFKGDILTRFEKYANENGRKWLFISFMCIVESLTANHDYSDKVFRTLISEALKAYEIIHDDDSFPWEVK